MFFDSFRKTVIHHLFAFFVRIVWAVFDSAFNYARYRLAHSKLARLLTLNALMYSCDAILACYCNFRGLSVLINSGNLDGHQFSALLMKMFLTITYAFHDGPWFITRPTNLSVRLRYLRDMNAARYLLPHVDLRFILLFLAGG